jgi:hypothetical protein
MPKQDLRQIWNELQTLLATYDKRLEATPLVWKSKTVAKKPAYHLYGKKLVAIGRRPAQPTYFAGIIQQKHFVGLYIMPIYSHPRLLAGISPELKRMVKGKSCVNVDRLTPALKKELRSLLKAGYALYKKEGWL